MEHLPHEPECPPCHSIPYLADSRLVVLRTEPAITAVFGKVRVKLRVEKKL